METVLLDLLKQPTAIVELGIAILAFVYMAQLVFLERGGLLGERALQTEGRPAGIQRNNGGIRYDRISRLSPVVGKVTYFHRMLHADVSDRGAIFPKGPVSPSPASSHSAKLARIADREASLKLYGVGTYLSSEKRSLRKSSANRMRFPN